MHRFTLLAASLLPFTLLGNCNGKDIEAHVKLPNESATIEVFSEGRLRRSTVAPRDSAHLSTLKRIVEGRNGQWQQSWTAHSPEIIIRIGKTKASFHKGTIVLNYKTELGNPRQVECSMSDEEFAEVRNATQCIFDAIARE
jgi:hypothetical protein